MRVDMGAKTVSDVRFRSNGCGYMIATSDLLADLVKGLQLGELHGLDNEDLSLKIDTALDVVSSKRRQCVDVCIEALRLVFADFRSRQIEEFRGENALVCTCFGVTEETIETYLNQQSIKTVEDVTNVCNAGGGCGSCRMLIQEMIDIRVSGF